MDVIETYQQDFFRMVEQFVNYKCPFAANKVHLMRALSFKSIILTRVCGFQYLTEFVVFVKYFARIERFKRTCILRYLKLNSDFEYSKLYVTDTLLYRFNTDVYRFAYWTWCKFSYWPSGFRYDHLGAELVELVPQVFGLQPATDVSQLFRVTPFLEQRVDRGHRGRGGGRRGRHRWPRWRAGRGRRYDYLVGRRCPGRPHRDHRVGAQTPFSLRFSVCMYQNGLNRKTKNKTHFYFEFYRLLTHGLSS